MIWAAANISANVERIDFGFTEGWYQISLTDKTMQDFDALFEKYFARREATEEQKEELEEAIKNTNTQTNEVSEIATSSDGIKGRFLESVQTMTLDEFDKAGNKLDDEMLALQTAQKENTDQLAFELGETETELVLIKRNEWVLGRFDLFPDGFSLDISYFLNDNVQSYLYGICRYLWGSLTLLAFYLLVRRQFVGV